MSKRPWFCKMGVQARKALSVLLALELCVAGVPVTAFAEEDVDNQEAVVQAEETEGQDTEGTDAGEAQDEATVDEGASLEAAGEDELPDGEIDESVLGQLELPLYQFGRNPYFGDCALEPQAVTPGLAGKLTQDQYDALKQTFTTAMKNVDKSQILTVKSDKIGQKTIASFNLNREEIQAIVADIINSEPDLWYVNSSVMTNYDQETVYVVVFQYLFDGADLETKKANYEASMQDLLSWVPPASKASTEERIKAVHDWLVRNVTYDTPASESTNPTAYINQQHRDPWSAYGAMVDGEAVCQGYSLAYLSAMQRLGIECGIATTPVHQWNRVKIGAKWYHVDVTFDDPTNMDTFDVDPLYADYFLKSDTKIQATDAAYEVDTHTDWQLPEPKCTDDTYDDKTEDDWPTYSGPFEDKVSVNDLTITIPAGTGANGAYEYTGSQITPKPTIKDGDTTLVEGTDYTLSYGTNKNPGTGSVTVTGKNGYEDSVTKTFTIVKKKIPIPTAKTGLVYNGSNQAGVDEGEGYTFVGTKSAVNANSYTAIAKLSNKTYTMWSDGTTTDKTINWSIAKKPIAIPTAVTGLVYNKQVQEGVKAGEGYSLDQNSKGVDAQSYSTVATLASTNYKWSDNTTGTKSITWSIAKAKLADPQVKTGLVYNGSAQTGVTAVDGVSLSGTVTATDAKTYSVQASLVNSNYQWNNGSTTAKNLSWTISPLAINSSTVVVSKIADQSYTGKQIKPAITVKYNGKTLTKDKDYELSYGANIDVGPGTVVIKGKGNFNNVRTETFQIVKSTSATWTRYAGDNAIETGKAVVEADNGSVFEAGRGGTVIVATNDGYWDALAAAGLAGTLDAPVLITTKGSLATKTKEEIQRLKPSRALIMGGTAAVSDSVKNEIAAMGINTTRVAGDNAVLTAVQIYRAGSGWSDTAIVATSNGYWDALSVAPYAWWRKAPIFLTDTKGNIGDAAFNAIKAGGFKRVVIVGGTAAVTSGTANKFKSAGLSVERLYGATALDTSAHIAKWEIGEGMGMSHLSVATSDGYWDALTGAAVCGKNASVLVLVGKDGTKDPWRAFDALKGEGTITHGHVYGGTGAVSQAAWDHFTKN
ncbi:MAG: cell wall-binding repeat-containing protein [Atopobiaceae bacterium]|nr:cell wall-binding repeat-containing protein [Atopobiaceae bacterium]